MIPSSWIQNYSPSNCRRRERRNLHFKRTISKEHLKVYLLHQVGWCWCFDCYCWTMNVRSSNRVWPHKYTLKLWERSQNIYSTIHDKHTYQLKLQLSVVRRWEMAVVCLIQAGMGVLVLMWTSSHMLGTHLTNQKIVFRSLTNQRTVFRSLTNQRIVFKSLINQRIVFKSLTNQMTVFR